MSHAAVRKYGLSLGSNAEKAKGRWWLWEELFMSSNPVVLVGGQCSQRAIEIWDGSQHGLTQMGTAEEE